MASSPSESRFLRADAILDAVLELPARERPAFITERCAGCRELAELVGRLLARCEDSDLGLIPGGALVGGRTAPPPT